MTLDPAEAWTRRLLRKGGVREGMRVLDIGCGAGTVGFLAADLVGERGSVIGVDLSEDAVNDATRRAGQLGLRNARFVRADIAALPESLGVFDAIIGRRVLMYQEDMSGALRGLRSVLASGGRIVLQEHNPASAPVCRPAMPLHETVHRWIRDTIVHEGANPDIGFVLPGALTDAGFTVERVVAEATVLTPGQAHPIAVIVRAMQDRIVNAAVATPEEIDIGKLEERLDAERRRAGTVCLWEMVFGLWGRAG